MAKKTSNTLSADQRKSLINILQARFEKNMNRHPSVKWELVQKKMEADSAKLSSLQRMEETGGEPDVVGVDSKTGEFIFMDCSSESPAGRRSLCYDREALDERKENKPANSAMDLAAEIGIEILNEDQYRQLQQLGRFDTKTSSWIQTPAAIRKLGGALFCDFRYGQIFVYHNGAQSYYAARGFRGSLKI